MQRYYQYEKRLEVQREVVAAFLVLYWYFSAAQPAYIHVIGS